MDQWMLLIHPIRLTYQINNYINKQQVVTKLVNGDFFGEIGLLYESKRTASIRASGYCEIYVLRKLALEKILKRYPEQQKYMMNVADTRITNDSLRELLKRLWVI